MTRAVYLALCVVGVCLPMSQFIPWLATQAIDRELPTRFVMALFSTRIGAFFGIDVIVSALVLFVFIRIEGRRLAIAGCWLPVVGTFAIGVSFGLPLFLYLRQVAIEAAGRPVDSRHIDR